MEITDVQETGLGRTVDIDGMPKGVGGALAVKSWTMSAQSLQRCQSTGLVSSPLGASAVCPACSVCNALGKTWKSRSGETSRRSQAPPDITRARTGCRAIAALVLVALESRDRLRAIRSLQVSASLSTLRSKYTSTSISHTRRKLWSNEARVEKNADRAGTTVFGDSRASIRLLDGHRLGQVAREVDIDATSDGNVVRAARNTRGDGQLRQGLAGISSAR